MDALKNNNMNDLSRFTPMMHKAEYELVQRYLNKDDIFLEWGSGNSTLYFSQFVKQIISIEHNRQWLDNVREKIDANKVTNVLQVHVPAVDGESKDVQFKDYIDYPKNNGLKFTKVLIDGRARKFCAKAIYDMIDENIIVFIHDYNRPDYRKVEKYYDVIERTHIKPGIVALRKKPSVVLDKNSY